MSRKAGILLSMAAIVAVARADVITTKTLQVGGFLDGGLYDNKIEHQNYYVGYGTVGGTRSPERRSFFWYHIPTFTGEVLDVSIKLKMPFKESLIFGLDASDPTKHDPIEKFQLGATLIDHFTLTDPTLTEDEAQTIFDDFDDHPVASAFEFSMDKMYDFPMTVEIHLDDFGKGIVGSHRGADVVFTGWMPTWSYDDRKDSMGHYLEADELLFGLSDVPGGVPEPELTILYEPVPEPCTLLVGGGLVAAALARRRKR